MLSERRKQAFVERAYDFPHEDIRRISLATLGRRLLELYPDIGSHYRAKEIASLLKARLSQVEREKRR